MAGAASANAQHDAGVRASNNGGPASSSSGQSSSLPPPAKTKRGRPRKDNGSNGGSSALETDYAAVQRQGMVAVSALNACLEHDSLAGARAVAGKEAAQMLEAAQEALLHKGFLVLYVDAAPR